MSGKALVAGVGMVPFRKPGRHEGYEVMAPKAIQAALNDAGLDYTQVQQAYAGYIFGDTCCGQKAIYQAGMTGIPLFNVNNACSTGSTALYLARQAVESGLVDCALAVGFEEMLPGAIAGTYTDRTSPVDHFYTTMNELGYSLECGMGIPKGGTPCLFGAGGIEYMNRYDAKPEIFAKVAVKTRSHAVHNPYSIFDKPLTVEEVMESPVIWEPYLTRFMACPPTCGAAAAIVCSEAFATKHGIDRSVRIRGQALVTDTPRMYESAIDLVGQDMCRRAAEQVYEDTGVGPEDVDVVELHDCFTPNEVLTYEGLGLCAEGEATKFIEDGDNTYGGQVVVNPSGGLMSKGHPIGATGLAQCFELVNQMRGAAGQRQVPDARIGLQHNLGLGGAAVVTMYEAA